MKNAKGHRTSPMDETKKNLHFNPYSWLKLFPQCKLKKKRVENMKVGELNENDKKE